MTTAHRPTWKAAVGRADEGGWSAGGASSSQRSALDAPAHTKLKFRDLVPAKSEALQKSLAALEQAEQETAVQLLKKKQRTAAFIDPAVEERARTRLLKQIAEVDHVKLKEKYNDSDVEVDDDDDDSDKDSDESDLDVDDDDDGSDSSSDDDDDDEAALQAELAKIRAERQEATARAAEKAQAAETAQLQEAALVGNPLLNINNSDAAVAGGGRLKRRWNDDVVFRNQAKGEPAPKKRFINDTVRNDFHKRFLNKFIR